MNIKELKEYIKDLPDNMELNEYYCWLDRFYQPAMHILRTWEYLLIKQIKWNTEQRYE